MSDASFSRVFIVRDSACLKRLRQQVGSLKALPPNRISLEIPQLPGITRLTFEAQLNHHYQTCGCKAGAVSAFLALSIYMLHKSFFATPEDLITLDTLLHVLIIPICGGLIGKVIGLTFSRLALWLSIRKLESLCSYKN